MAVIKSNTQAWAVMVFLVAVIAAFLSGQALVNDAGALFAMFVIEFLACLLWLVYLRRADLRQNTWCEARR